MKVVLINPPYLSLYGPDRGAVKSHFSLGLGYVAAYLIKNGINVSYLDPEAERLDVGAFKEKLKKIGPDVVGITSTTATFQSAKDIASAVKKSVDSTVVLGGPHASVLPEHTIEKDRNLFDFVVVGEGEVTMLQLCRAIENGEDPSSIDGLCFFKGGEVLRSGARKVVSNLDDIPMPGRDLVDMNLYLEPNDFNSIGKRAATMFTSRACPYACVFCASQAIWGREVRYHSPARVVEEIKLLNEKYGVEHILFKDDTFGIKRDRVVEICEGILGLNKKLWFSCLARVDSFDEEAFKLMKRAGFFHICFGVESGNAEILKNLKKKITKEQARSSLKIANKLGFKTLCTFMIGNPGDTRETVEETIQFANELSPVIALFYILVPYPGTEIFKQRISDADFLKLEWEDFVISKGSFIADSENLTAEEMRKFLKKAYLRFYIRPKALWNILRQIKGIDEILIYARGGLGLLKRIFSLSKKH